MNRKRTSVQTVRMRVSRDDCQLLRCALSAAGESDTFHSDDDQAALDEAHELVEKALARTGALWLTMQEAHVDTLVSVIEFVSESEAFHSDDAALDRLWRTLRQTGTKLTRQG